MLNGEHPLGRNKAVVFESALGFNQRNGYLLIGKIKQALKKYPAIEAGTDQYGRRYNVDMEISGPNGMTAWVRTAWILPVEGNVPRLITLFVLKQMR